MNLKQFLNGNKRKADRISFPDMTDAFSKFKEKMELFVTQKDGHMNRLGIEIDALLDEKTIALKEQIQAKNIIDNANVFFNGTVASVDEGSDISS